MKRILTIVAACLFAGVHLFATEVTDEQGVTYDYAGKTGKIKSFSGKVSRVVIPSPVKLNGAEFTVNRVATDAFMSSTVLESISLPKELKYIDEGAFYGCEMLYKVEFAEGTELMSIGEKAFFNCTSLIDITIKARVEDEVTRPTIYTNGANNTFSGVRNLIYIQAKRRPDKYPWGARGTDGYVDGYLLFGSDDSGKTKVLFCAPAARGTVVIPNSVTSIASLSFEDCKNMTSVVIPASATFESRIFTGCSGLTSIVCKCVTPPVSAYYDDKSPEFQGVNKDIPIYVPKESIDAYKKAKGWNQFTNYQEWSEEKESELSNCTLTLKVNDEKMGTVKGAGTYTSGNNATIEAVPAEGYKFLQWSDNNTENPRTFQVTSSMELTAIFVDQSLASNKVILTLFVNDPNMGEVFGAGEYEKGTLAIIEAKAKEGYVFVKWSDGSKLSVRNQTMEANMTLTAEFAAASSETPVTYTITVSANDGSMGTVTGGGTYEPNAQVTLTATPKEGFVFVKWSDGNTDNPRTLAATANANFIAIFASNSQGVEIVESQKSKVESKKVLRDGQIIIVREGAEYNTLGVKLQ